ncbi:MAG TPA: tRNA dihydrouridine synthase DusB [Firmicutes bacterium]|jgi:tRNA-dihydrouridine synthase B|nr:tRNA dihydrouridine synthase DusB [Bacillota bacterium]
MVKIGSVLLKNPVILAPMAGVTDPPFRAIVKGFDPGLVCGEMVSAMALHYQSDKTREMIGIDEGEKPISIQIFGSNPRIMAEAARFIEAEGADLIDINMGCPVPKVVKSGEGAALLTNLPLAETIIREVVNSVKIPVTVKFRLGWDRDRIVAPELARIAEEQGAAAVALHARTREQFYQGKADWSYITELKQKLRIPVIGNGDVDSPEAAKAMLEQTGCDGVMIGQAALGRPWLFGRVVRYLETGRLFPDPPLSEQFRIIEKHLQLQTIFSGEQRGLLEMRKHLSWYIKGMPGAAKMRDKVNTMMTLGELKQALREFESEILQGTTI